MKGKPWPYQLSSFLSTCINSKEEGDKESSSGAEFQYAAFIIYWTLLSNTDFLVQQHTQGCFLLYSFLARYKLAVFINKQLVIGAVRLPAVRLRNHWAAAVCCVFWGSGQTGVEAQEDGWKWSIFCFNAERRLRGVSLWRVYFNYCSAVCLRCLRLNLYSNSSVYVWISTSPQS